MREKILRETTKQSSMDLQESAVKEPFLAVLRELAQAYHAFSAYSAAHVRQLGLTPAQFDVIATLGNTQGMPLSQLAQKTLITKGTLTGIIDRLEEKGLVRREVPAGDRRSFRAVLTPEGEALFSRVFPTHTAYLRQTFADVDADDLEQVRRTLRALRGRFQVETKI
ncbi:MarR family winged helix-turn-helix transcriptional regulator [Acidithiobacillus sp.]|jgi:DNA-binding MarR family transcriptional regulator|uniref:MarR family winged helix-turn-helix transcriptional regulator n=1 Tax=Acidithiobacillus sp. TaxID=1872118 RepID=UPI0025B82692|nr:MarR family transcriptional regulator [Acidithiobacillus sp.]MCK9187795.1 MarR family transcriptional regulator [Acidithiobacillus sp.]MCK9358685.1 MarR family transcriptional regulator [Acidithiobacillus sp.]